ncbi:MAG: phosphatase PAP2 family protein [Pseudorhodoplanes sp.]|uniref:phosphatase PAP2 family protein n=1 Tax=Pseudorhodoplanes sp. TaxID=1934341 RepID=UPI003D0CD8D3
MTAGAWAPLLAGLGDLRLVLAGTAAGAGFLAYRRDFELARAFVIGILLCMAATAALKIIGLVLEHWPAGALIGSPSGHAALATAFGGSIALVLSHNRSMEVRWFLAGCVALAISAVAFSRIDNGAHTLFEVMEGILAGLAGLVPLAILLGRCGTVESQDAVPAWPFIMLLVLIVVLHEGLGLRDLDTEAVVRLLANMLPAASHH